MSYNDLIDLVCQKLFFPQNLSSRGIFIYRIIFFGVSVQSQEDKGTKEHEMVGCHHQLDGHEFEQAPGVGDGWGSLACCSPWGCKESDTTEWLNWIELKVQDSVVKRYSEGRNWNGTWAHEGFTLGMDRHEIFQSGNLDWVERVIAQDPWEKWKDGVLSLIVRGIKLRRKEKPSPIERGGKENRMCT